MLAFKWHKHYQPWMTLKVSTATETCKFGCTPQFQFFTMLFEFHDGMKARVMISDKNSSHWLLHKLCWRHVKIKRSASDKIRPVLRFYFSSKKYCYSVKKIWSYFSRVCKLITCWFRQLLLDERFTSTISTLSWQIFSHWNKEHVSHSCTDTYTQHLSEAWGTRNAATLHFWRLTTQVQIHHLSSLPSQLTVIHSKPYWATGS